MTAFRERDSPCEFIVGDARKRKGHTVRTVDVRADTDMVIAIRKFGLIESTAWYVDRAHFTFHGDENFVRYNVYRSTEAQKLTVPTKNHRDIVGCVLMMCLTILGLALHLSRIGLYAST